MSPRLPSRLPAAWRIRSTRTGGSADILLAATLWGTAGPVFTFAPSEANAISVASARIVIGGLALLTLVAGAGRPRLRRLLLGDRRTLVVVLGALCAAVYQVAYLMSVARTGVAVSTAVALGSAPAFTGLLAWSGPSRRWLITTAGAVIGCAMLVTCGREGGADPLGVGLALASGLTYAAYTTLAALLIRRGEDNNAVMAAMFGGAGLLLLPVLLAGSPGRLLLGTGALVAGYLGLVTTGLAYVLFSRGLRRTPAPTATTLTLAEPAVAAVLGLAVLDEHLGGIALAGLFVLGASLIILAVPGWRAERTAPGDQEAAASA